jgi:hypothetical protein
MSAERDKTGRFAPGDWLGRKMRERVAGRTGPIPDGRPAQAPTDAADAAAEELQPPGESMGFGGGAPVAGGSGGGGGSQELSEAVRQRVFGG